MWWRGKKKGIEYRVRVGKQENRIKMKKQRNANKGKR